ncbi:DUF742 domain-containing protein [Spirillospora sp. NPDC048819]|uniref:DUF742 domain-containing protein n=1 Tax=Spirillospora sp. NPDC048819 TaxID=3155268 RepID=UPI0033C6003D
MSGEYRAGPWVDQDVQQVRPYVVAGGRSCPRYAMGLDTVLTTRSTDPAADTARIGVLAPETAHALGLCRAGDRSVAEIAATIDQPILVTKTILSDLIDAGALAIAPPTAQPDPDTGRPSPHLLQALLEGLEAHDFAVA